MKDSDSDDSVLSKRELEVLLERLSDKGNLASWSGVSRKEVGVEARLVSLSLQRASELFAERISRSMSNVFQTSIHFTLINWRDTEPEEFEQLMVPTDHAVVFELVPGAGRGIMLIGRMFLFQLYCINLGANPTLKQSAPPVRAYTAIERRFYRSFAEDLLSRLGESWSDGTKISPKITGLIERKHVLQEIAEELYLATFDVAGFGEVCRLRVAVPKAAFEDRIAAAREVTSLTGAQVEEAVLDMALVLRAEIGSVQMTLRDFSNMTVGDVIELDGIDGGELLTTVAGIPKFHAIRGVVGRRLAVQLTDRI